MQYQQRMIWVLKKLIRLYKVCLSPWLGHRCRYFPTCSEYALEALNSHGFYGMWLVLQRLLRCHPFGGHGVDPVPRKEIKGKINEYGK